MEWLCRLIFHDTCKEGKVTLAEDMLKAMARVNWNDEYNNYACHLRSGFSFACLNAQVGVVEKLLQHHNPIELDKEEKPGHPSESLILVIHDYKSEETSQDRLRLVKLLLNKGFKVHGKDDFDETSLTRACRMGLSEIVPLLLAKDKTLISQKGSLTRPITGVRDEKLLLPIEIAKRQGHTQIVTYLQNFQINQYCSFAAEWIQRYKKTNNIEKVGQAFGYAKLAANINFDHENVGPLFDEILALQGLHDAATHFKDAEKFEKAGYWQEALEALAEIRLSTLVDNPGVKQQIEKRDARQKNIQSFIEKEEKAKAKILNAEKLLLEKKYQAAISLFKATLPLQHATRQDATRKKIEQTKQDYFDQCKSIGFAKLGAQAYFDATACFTTALSLFDDVDIKSAQANLSQWEASYTEGEKAFSLYDKQQPFFDLMAARDAFTKALKFMPEDSATQARLNQINDALVTHYEPLIQQQLQNLQFQEIFDTLNKLASLNLLNHPRVMGHEQRVLEALGQYVLSLTPSQAAATNGLLPVIALFSENLEGQANSIGINPNRKQHLKTLANSLEAKQTLAKAATHYEAQDFKAAQGAFEKVLRLEPENETANNQLQRVEGDIQAQQFYQKGLGFCQQNLYQTALQNFGWALGKVQSSKLLEAITQANNRAQ